MRTLLRLLSLALVCGAANAREYRHEITNVPLVQESSYYVSPWIEVTLPEGLASLQILVSGSPDALVQVSDLIAPDGTIYITRGGSREGKLSAYSNPILSNVKSPNRNESVIKGFGSVIVPNNPSLSPPKAGVWRLRSFTLYKPMDQKVSFYLVGKFNEELSRRRIDLRVWVSPNSYWTSSIGQVDRLVAMAKAVLVDQVGFELKVLSVELLPARPSTPMKLPQELAQIAFDRNDPNAVNLYLMPTMEHQNKPVNGLSCLGGPVRSIQKHGCFISMFAADEGADTISLSNQGKIMVHELGHYLGLFHTQDDGYDRIGLVHDSLDDTPEQITGTNMMDPGIFTSTPHFTPQQRRMMLLSPAFQL